MSCYICYKFFFFFSHYLFFTVYIFKELLYPSPLRYGDHLFFMRIISQMLKRDPRERSRLLSQQLALIERLAWWYVLSWLPFIANLKKASDSYFSEVPENQLQLSGISARIVGLPCLGTLGWSCCNILFISCMYCVLGRVTDHTLWGVYQLYWGQGTGARIFVCTQSSGIAGMIVKSKTTSLPIPTM